MKHFILIVSIILSALCSTVTAQAWEIKIEPNQVKDSLYFMTTETSPIKYRYGRGKFVPRSTMKSLLGVPSLASIRSIIHDSLTTIGGGSTPGIDDVLAVVQDISTNRDINVNGNSFRIVDGGSNIFQMLSGQTYIGDPDGNLNGNTFSVKDADNKSYLDNTAHNINVGINKPDPSVALDVVGDAKISGTINGVKRYVALLTQSGTDPPVATIELENSLGSVTFTYEDAGVYKAVTSGLYTSGKTFFELRATSNGALYGLNPSWSYELNDDSNITLHTNDTDASLTNTWFSITVYP